MKTIHEDYQEFLKAPEVSVPQNLTQVVQNRVSRDLNPGFLNVFKKTLLIQLMAGALSLSFCPQLGVGPLFGGEGLMGVFMQWGPFACTALCGALFFGLGAITSVLILTREELREFKRHKLLQIGTITAIAFMALVMAGAEVIHSQALAWTIGSALTGWLVYKMGIQFRMAFHSISQEH